MKPPKDRAETALYLGKAAQHASNIEAIMEACHLESNETEISLKNIMKAIDRGIRDLNPLERASVSSMTGSV